MSDHKHDHDCDHGHGSHPHSHDPFEKHPVLRTIAWIAVALIVGVIIYVAIWQPQ